MKKTNTQIFDEDFKVLDELIQKVSDIITPFSFRDELRAVMNKETRKNHCEKHPKCWMPVNIGNKDIPFLPICNRSGATDKNMIAFAMKLAKRLNDVENVDRGMLQITMQKLDRLHNKYSQDTPKPYGMAAQKGKVTKSLSIMKQYMDKIKQGS